MMKKTGDVMKDVAELQRSVVHKQDINSVLDCSLPDDSFLFGLTTD